MVVPTIYWSFTMKRIKKNGNVSRNTKISSYFAKVPKEAEFQNNKRKTVEPEGLMLSSETNFSQSCKKAKHRDENGVPIVNSVNSFEATTPEKHIQPSTSMKTPPSRKKFSKKHTPKKLYDKSPFKVDEFNVQVLEDFVKLSPSTSSKVLIVNGASQRENTHRVQSSIKQIVSPSTHNSLTSPRTLKESTGSLLLRSDSPKVKTKLNFVENVISPNSELLQDMDNAFSDEDCDSLLDSLLLHEDLNSAANELTFEEAQHCKILGVNRTSNETILKLKSTKNRKIGFCKVQGFWSSSNYFKTGDSVSISARKSGENEWIVDNETGWLVYEPDLLISCTSVSSSLHCKRRAVLAERYRGFDPPNRIMIIGTLAHTLLQRALTEKLETADEMEKLLATLINSKNTLKRLYESDLTLNEIESELQTFVPKLVEFISEYLKDDPLSRPRPANWQGRIIEIDDIEENVWCPQLGVKGKIDITAVTDSGVVMPMEVKTGRASVSLEHRGQLVLYLMMMNKFGYQSSSGLLFYLREGVLKEIPATLQEKRDLMILRNELAYFLTKKISKAPELPQPVNSRRTCSMCPYNTICTTYLRYETHNLTNNTAIRDLQKAVTSHLSQSHLDYFLHWSHLSSLEAECNKDSKSIQDIYTIEPVKREAKGRCIINIKVVHIGIDKNGLFEHTFEKEKPPLFNLESYDVLDGNYVIVSTDHRPAVACGFVTEVSSSKILVVLDRNLNLKYKEQNFHLDTYDTNTSYIFNLTSLAMLLKNTPRAAELRSIIVDKSTPTFLEKLPSAVAKKGAPILRRLNHVQQKAVLKALSAKDFLLIKGMPGTGKTATIVALIQLLMELDNTVLITSHTHSAIDNICTRLQTFGIEFLRLGSEKKVAANLKNNTEAFLTEKCTTPEEMAQVYNRFKVIAVTCLGSNHPVLSKRTMDVCIVDESTLVVQTSMIKCLYAAKKFVLIGDPDQLSPLVKNREAINAGMAESLFERLTNPEGTVTLNLNYRMNKTITDLANILTYNGQLKPGNEIVANRTLQIPNVEALTSSLGDHQWLEKALNTSLEAAVQFIDTGPVWKLPKPGKRVQQNPKPDKDFQNCINIHEVAIVVKLVKTLIQGGVSTSDIGVIATYRSQVAQISLELNAFNIDVSTVDQFQGLDKNVIIYSCTKSAELEGNSRDAVRFEILEDKRRLTVAITRAKRKLLIVGDLETLKNYECFAKIISALETNIIQFGSCWSIINDL